MRAKVKLISYSYYYFFVLVFCWEICRILYFSDAFFNFSFKYMTIIRNLAMVLFLSCMSIAMFTVTQLYLMMRHLNERPRSMLCQQCNYYTWTTLAICIQLVNIVIACSFDYSFEDGDETKNGAKALRSILTTMCLVVFSVFNILYFALLMRTIRKFPLLK